jgi:hypothetical protein
LLGKVNRLEFKIADMVKLQYSFETQSDNDAGLYEYRMKYQLKDYSHSTIEKLHEWKGYF